MEGFMLTLLLNNQNKEFYEINNIYHSNILFQMCFLDIFVE